MRVLLVLLVLAAAAGAQSVKERKPNPNVRGKFYSWKAKDGLPFLWRVPKSYSHKRGEDLLLSFDTLRPNGRLVLRWDTGDLKRFPEMLIVSTVVPRPPGYTPDRATATRVHALLEQVKTTFHVRDRFAFGYWESASFALFYAGLYPQDVGGVVAMGPRRWKEIRITDSQKHHAILLYTRSASPFDKPNTYLSSLAPRHLFESYVKKELPKVHLFALPRYYSATRAETQAIAWCYGMTTKEPAALEDAYAVFRHKQSPGSTDFAGLYRLAQRVIALPEAPSTLKGKLRKAQQAIERLAALHKKAIAASVGKSDGTKFEDRAWVGHIPCFLDVFRGTRERDAFEYQWRLRLREHARVAQPHLKVYAELREKDPAGAFEAGVAAIRVGFLYPGCSASPFLDEMLDWSKSAARLKLKKAERRFFDRFYSARNEGIVAYDALCAKFKLP